MWILVICSFLAAILPTTAAAITDYPPIMTTLRTQPPARALKSTEPKPSPSTTTAESSTDTSTPAASFCHQYYQSGCPNGWFLADTDLCLANNFERVYYNYETVAKRQCVGNLLNETDITTNLRSCLLRALPQNEHNFILLHSYQVVNLMTGDVSTLLNDHRGAVYVVCGVRLSIFERKPISGRVFPPEEMAFSQFETFNETISGAPTITSFNLQIFDLTRETTREVDLLGADGIIITIGESEDFLRLTCKASGFPQPTIKFNSVEANWTGGKSGKIVTLTLELREASCANSGGFVCEASNSVGRVFEFVELQIKDQLQITSFNVTHDISYWGKSPLQIGMPAVLNCATVGCPSAKAVSISNDDHLELCRGHRGNVSCVIHNVNCSDMGNYICRAEGVNGEYLQRTAELVVLDRCLVQLCRGEQESKTVSATLGQTLNISVCLMSSPSPNFERQPQDRKVSVTFRRTPSSQIFIRAHIIIPNISHTDFRTYKIGIRNFYGLFVYNVTLIHEAAGNTHTLQEVPVPEENPENQPHPSTLPQERVSWLETNGFLTITVPVIAANIVIVLMFVMFLYWKRGGYITLKSALFT